MTAWPEMAMNLFGGLALFLFGLGEMAEALKSSAGAGLRGILARLTANRFAAALTGTLVTAVIQSSSVTTVLVVGFVSAGTMTLTQSIGVILGANVGTTITVQILAFEVTKYALLLVAAGFALLFLGASDRSSRYGKIVMGLGLVFFGMALMGEAMTPLRGSSFFLRLMETMRNPLAGILAGAFMTAVLQASAATMGIVIVLAGQGLVSLEAGIALALGANIGTCATALLAALGRPADARRAALVHLLFNVAGALLWVGFIEELASIAVAISGLLRDQGGEVPAASIPRQIANANTIFNVANTLVFLPFAGLFASLVTRLVPEKPAAAGAAVAPRFLDEALVSTPALALERVRMELGHMGEIVQEMFRDLWSALSAQRRDLLEEVARHDEGVDTLEESIVRYLSRIRKAELSERESSELGQLMAATAFMENLGDLVESEMVPLGEEAVAGNLYARSEDVRSLLAELYGKVVQAVAVAAKAVRDRDGEAALEVLARKAEIDGLAEKVLGRQSRDLAVSGRGDFRVFRFQTELLERLRRTYSLAKRLARTVPPEEGAGGSKAQ